jgi:cytochrome b6-f complex iron-sulfur subunit
MNRLRRYVEGLIQGRRPKPFPASEDEAEAVRAAIELRAARPGADSPSEEFVAGLHRRLAQAHAEPARMPVGRRLVLGGAVAGAGVAAGVSIDRAIVPDEEGTPTAGGTVSPDSGVWHRVAATTDLAEGGVRGFEAGGVFGFVTRAGGRVRAVSGICTHQGCKLNLEAGTKLRCPCHRALFGLDGAVIQHRLPIDLPALPRLAVRETGGAIEVYVPGS